MLSISTTAERGGAHASRARASGWRASVFLLGCLIAVLASATTLCGQSSKAPSDKEKSELKKLDADVSRHLSADNWREALPLAKELLAAKRRHYGESSFEVAAAKNQLAFALAKSGESEQAIPYYRQSLAVIEKLKGEGHENASVIRTNLADACSSTGRFADALPLYEQTLRIHRQTLEEDDPLLAKSHNSVGYCQYQLGNFPDARANLERAIAILRKTPDRNGAVLASSLNNLAGVHQAQGNNLAAMPIYDEALQISRKVNGEMHDLTAALYNNLASLYQRQSDLPRAREAYQNALSIRRKVLGEGHLLYSVTLGNLASVQFDEKDYAGSLAGYERCLAIQRKAVGYDHPVVAQTLHRLAAIHQAQSRFSTASDYYQESLDVSLAAVGNIHPDTIRTREDLARNELLAGQDTSALRQLTASRRATRRHVARILPGLSDREQSVYLTSVYQPRFREALANAFMRRTNAAYGDASASWLVNGKGVAQELLAEREQLLRRSAGDQASPGIQKLIEIRRQLAAQSMGGDASSNAKLGATSLKSLQEEEARLAREAMQGMHRQSTPGEWHELADVRSAISPGSVLIDFARFQSGGLKSDDPPIVRYAAWIVPPAGQGSVQIVDLGAASEIEAAINETRQAIGRVSASDSVLRSQGEESAEREFKTVVVKLRDRVWAPLAAALPADVKHLILCPEAELWLLPWDALPVTEARWLVEDYSLRFVTSGRDLLTREPDEAVKTTTALLFADPDFDLSVDAIRKAIQAVFPKRKIGPNQTRGGFAASSLSDVARLPNTRVEAEFITPSITKIAGSAPRMYADRFALESVVKSVHRPRMLVLSTHGFFLTDQKARSEAAASDDATRSAKTSSCVAELESPLLRCGLLFAGCNSKQYAGEDDGILTGMEIVGIDLVGTELVVLSACETGLGQVNHGEGVAGLRQAFQLAGAESVVATLWQVPDRDSAQLMNEFFVNLAAGQSKADALRNAQLSRIASRRERYGAAHPFFWAAWTVTGQ